MKQFLIKLLLLFKGELPDYNEILVLKAELIAVRKQLRDALIENAKIGKDKMVIPVSGFDNLDIEPLDEKERLRYAGRVDEFYQDILRPKIQVQIAEIRRLIANVGYESYIPPNISRDEYDHFLRGMEASLWGINDWATTLQGELKDNT